MLLSSMSREYFRAHAIHHTHADGVHGGADLLLVPVAHSTAQYPLVDKRQQSTLRTHMGNITDEVFLTVECILRGGEEGVSAATVISSRNVP